MTLRRRGGPDVGADLKIEGAAAVVTGDASGAVLRNADLEIEAGRITYLGPRRPDDGWSGARVAGRDLLVYPGLVNAHHHMYQVLTRNLPAVEGAELFDWLRAQYPIWAGISEEMVYWSSLAAMGELLMSGCTTTMDHHYVFPAGTGDLVGHQFAAAKAAGIRFHASRGSMSLGRSAGGLPPDEVVQDEDEILADTERLILAHHDPAPYAMGRLVVAPCSPFSVTHRSMREAASLARRHGVRLHTHLAETKDEEDRCLQTTGHRPVALAEELGWLGPDVFFAHAVHLTDDEMDLLARTGTGVAHCATSNMLLHSGAARVRELVGRGVAVGLAVDGSASNDSSNMLAELRTAYLLGRHRDGPQAPDAHTYLRLATAGGAALLGRDDVGSLEVGKAGDLFAVRAGRLELSGALEDPAALPAVLGLHRPVDLTVVNGAVVYRDGRFSGFDADEAARKVNALARRLRPGT